MSNSIAVFTRSDLFEDGFTEDGEPQVSAAHYVVARDPEGYTFRAGSVIQRSPSFPDAAVLHELEAFIVARFADEAPSVDSLRASPDWYEIDPCYGSAAYQREGTEAKRRAAEIREDLEGGR